MSTEIKYDVFISSKSEDYHLAEKVYDFLTAKGLSVFLASKILEKLGESEYASKIDEVLDNSTHLIVVSSKLDHINSKWVKYEWSLFSSDLKSEYRQGNLLTILSNSIELKNLPASLRHRQSFRLDAYQENIMGYLVREDDDVDITLIPEEKQEESTSKRLPHGEIASDTVCKVIGNFFTTDTEFHTLTDKNLLFTTFKVNGVSLEMVPVKGGIFTMGATLEQGSDTLDNERPTHQVMFSDHMISVAEITQELWQAVMKRRRSIFKRDNLRVENISWDDYQEFVKKLNQLTYGIRPKGMVFLLPTEAEWKYLAKGGQKMLLLKEDLV